MVSPAKIKYYHAERSVPVVWALTGLRLECPGIHKDQGVPGYCEISTV